MSVAAGEGAGAVVRQGHLRKLKTMKKKFFVLRAESAECSARLEYYESEKKFRSGASPRRVLSLKSCYNITRRLDLKQKHVIALFTREEQFCIVAENEQELHAWLTAILKHHRSDDVSEELLHPIQHVWQVNVQKKGLGASKNIQGLYNLCLTDKTLALVKIKSHNNIISDLGIPERVEYTLKNIRRCGDSECFFYMEVGRQTTTGAGELWMHTDDSNIAQSMHSTIYHAMKHCAKETENERDHIIIPGKEGNVMPLRRQTYSDGSGRAGLSNAENQAPNNTLTDKSENTGRVIKHHRTVSLPTGCPLFQEPLKIVHERTRSAPLTGDEVDRAILEKAATYSSCKAVNGIEMLPKKSSKTDRQQWSRRASTGTRLSKLSPAHTKNAGLRSRCDSMPSRATSSFEAERPPQRHTELVEGLDSSRDEPDSVAEWHRTPRIPEEPDTCETRDFMLASLRPGIVASMALRGEETGSTMPGADGYLPMAPGHEHASGLLSASSGSVCSGTPSTDPRFSEYQLEPATSHLWEGGGGGGGSAARPARAYSVGSRPPARSPERHRAYSVGARQRPPPARHVPASAGDLMELDFSPNCAKVVVARTPPAAGFIDPRRSNVDEYVDMSPRNATAGYVEMRPGDVAPASRSPPAPAPAAPPDGYVEMNYGRAATRPIAIVAQRAPHTVAYSPDDIRRKKNGKEIRTPLGSQTLFPLSLDSPASPPEVDSDIFEEDSGHHPLSTVRELSEDGRKSPEPRSSPVKSAEVSSSPQYVTLVRPAAGSKPIAAPVKTPEPEDELSCNPLATKTIARIGDLDTKAEGTATVVLAGAGSGAPARFSVESPPCPPSPPPPPPTPAPTPAPAPLNYAALDLEPRKAGAAPPARAYTQIDFVRSEKLHVDGN